MGTIQKSVRVMCLSDLLLSHAVGGRYIVFAEGVFEEVFSREAYVRKVYSRSVYLRKFYSRKWGGGRHGS